MRYKSIFIIFCTTILLLFIPLIAMQFTEEVNWTLADFLIAALLLISTGLTINYILKKIKKPIFRIVLLMILLATFILIWLELAVGIFDSPISGS